ncbi:MAG: exo-alpha-sialidase [Chloroflexi bacterium]|nr:exo-alpha-sialidase [Chloroflexota bacterium]
MDTPVFSQTDLFISGTEGYHTFRIPAIVVTPRGAILALCEARKIGRDDAGKIDMVMRRSADGGQSWSPLQLIWDDGENTCGNPCPVVDRESGAVHLLMTHNLGYDTQEQIETQTSQGTRTVWHCQSTDDGLTWTRAVEITAAVKEPDWTWYATGPGAGIQLTGGRLVIPCDHQIEGSDKNRSHIIYSDDHGESWLLGGIVTEPGGDECEVVELENGTLLLNMRNYNRDLPGVPPCRAIAASADQGLTWSAMSYDPALIEPLCQASIRRLTTSQEVGRSRILFSNPGSTTARENMTVRLSYDEGHTWPVAKSIHAGPAAYSCLAVLPDQSIACFYERGDLDPHEKATLAQSKSAWHQKVTLARFNLAWLTDGADS